MQGVILAGGTGSRLFPLSKVISKHILPVGKYPMIYHPIMTLTRAGIQDITIVTGTEHLGQLVEQLGSGREFKANFNYVVQEEAGGIAQALGLVKPHIKTDRFAVILGDNVFAPSVCDLLLEASVDYNYSSEFYSCVFLKDVPDPHRFGVAELKDHLIKSIEEKPGMPKSNLAVTGLYIYDQNVFSFIKRIKPSKRNELEITDVNNHYLAQGALRYRVIPDFWSDAGTHESYKHTNLYLFSKGESDDWC